MGRLRNFRLKAILARLSPKWTIFCIVCVVVVYHEVVSFVVSSLRWPNLPAANQDDLRVLFVADPQLVGLQNEPALLGAITRRDADKYLQFGFFHAIGYVRPDVVIFLGDLLDEGSIASDDEYMTYVNRFHTVFRMPTNVKSIFASGDNDVGGEGFDLKQQWKVDRFRKYFEHAKEGNYDMGVTVIKHVNILKMSVDYGEKISQSQTDIMSDMRDQSTARFRIMCNHMLMLNRLPVEVSKICDILQPHLIVTAHTHLFQLYRCKDCRQLESADGKNVPATWKGQVVDVRDMPRPLIFNLTDVSHLYEIVVPTCSYRMGVPNMGYGAAVISKSGQMTFDVLWLPSRYRQLTIYVITLASIAGWFLMSFVCRYLKILYYFIIDMN